MHTAVMTCDFLLAAAYCTPEEMECRISDLAEYARSTQALGSRPILEHNAAEKLIDSGKYPCTGLFKSNISRLDENIYTAKDISRIVTNILEEGESFSYSDQRLWDSEEIFLNPEFIGLTPERNKQVTRLIEEVAIFNELESLDYSILHFCKFNSFDKTTFNAMLSEVIPAPTQSLPLHITRNVKIQSSYREYLTSLSFQKFLDNEQLNIELIKEFVYWRSLCELKKRNLPLENTSPDSFDFGPIFFESLKMNQCLPGQNFAGACFSSIVAVLTNDPAYEVNIFRKSAKSEEQKISGKFKAYRCHVTKGNVGLRLMFWRYDDNRIKFANVGPKNEIEIKQPE